MSTTTNSKAITLAYTPDCIVRHKLSKIWQATEKLGVNKDQQGPKAMVPHAWNAGETTRQLRPKVFKHRRGTSLEEPKREIKKGNKSGRQGGGDKFAANGCHGEVRTSYNFQLSGKSWQATGLQDLRTSQTLTAPSPPLPFVLLALWPSFSLPLLPHAWPLLQLASLPDSCWPLPTSIWGSD